MLSDTLGDMLSRIRNGQSAGHRRVNCVGSKLCLAVLEVLKKEGYIEGFTLHSEGVKSTFRIDLKKSPNSKKPIIRELNRCSKPSCRVYYKIKDLPRFYNGLGIYILSTSQGIMSDVDARKRKLGGEVLCEVF